MATLELQGLAKSFGKTTVLHGIDVSLTDGEMLVIVGGSGCGKSTLLRLVAGLESPSAGRILLDGRDITNLDPAKRDVAMVFQNYALYPHMSVFDNMAYGLKLKGLAKADIARRVEDAADTLSLSALLGRKPRELSGGQRQRVAMGRAIVREPKLFLFDEPLSNLDAKLRVQVRADIRKLQKRLNVTSLYVTHDQVEAMTLADRLAVMNEGRAAQLATPVEVFARPADRFVGGFIGEPAMNFCAARLCAGGRTAKLDAGPEIALPGDAPWGAEGTAVTIGIRPQHVVVETGPGHLPFAVNLVEPLGSEALSARQPAGRGGFPHPRSLPRAGDAGDRHQPARTASASVQQRERACGSADRPASAPQPGDKTRRRSADTPAGEDRLHPVRPVGNDAVHAEIDHAVNIGLVIDGPGNHRQAEAPRLFHLGRVQHFMKRRPHDRPGACHRAGHGAGLLRLERAQPRFAEPEIGPVHGFRLGQAAAPQ